MEIFKLGNCPSNYTTSHASEFYDKSGLNNPNDTDFKKIEINNKKLHEENGLVKLQNQALANSLKDVVKKASIEREVSKNEYSRKTHEVTNSLRKKVKSKEENANLVKEQYRQIQRIYAEKVNELIEKQAKIDRDLTENGKILPRRQTGLCAKHQRVLAIAIKRARLVDLLPFKGE